MEQKAQGKKLVTRLRQLATRRSEPSDAQNQEAQKQNGSATIAKQRLVTQHLYMGIDVQVRYACAWSLINEEGRQITSGWWEPEQAAEELRRQLIILTNRGFKVQVGIDAPRQPLARKRNWYWRNGQWERRKSSDKGSGRHSEVVIKSLNLGNPQWTPLASKAPPWMKLGFSLFKATEGLAVAHEVFPSAAYRMLDGVSEPFLTLNFSSFGHHPKDMLDACVAAVTVREYAQGRGGAAPSGDGLGEIILPMPLPQTDSDVINWPS